MSIFSSNELKLATNVLDQDEYTKFFQGARNAQIFTIALFSWFAYEYTITSIKELAFFWVDREWTRGRRLFFINRYTTWLAMIASLYVMLAQNPTLRTCTRAIYVLLVLNFLCIAIGQTYLSNKFWNIFEGRRALRAGLAVGLVFSIVLSFVLLFASDSHLTIVTTTDLANHLLVRTGCKAYPPERFWATYIPQLLFHGYLYSLAIYVAVRNRDLWELSEATRKVFWDGTAIFFVVLITSLCTIIFSSRTHMLWLSIPATFCPIMLTATSITLTRRAITTRMLLEHRTNVLEDSQDPMSNAIELMPMDARDRLNQRPMGMVRSVMEFTHSTRNSWTALPKSLGRTEVDS